MPFGPACTVPEPTFSSFRPGVAAHFLPTRAWRGRERPGQCSRVTQLANDIGLTQSYTTRLLDGWDARRSYGPNELGSVSTDSMTHIARVAKKDSGGTQPLEASKARNTTR